ncbi:MAG: GNAT family N-acetyltransferase [Candidatus Nanopelagicales bacterium]
MSQDLPSIRPYLANDMEQVLRLETSFTTNEVYRVKRDGDSFLIAPERVSESRLKVFDLREELIAADWDEAYVAVRPDGVVGFTATKFVAWHRRQGLQHLYVSPDWRRRGVGAALLSAVKARAVQNGASHVWLETTNVNVPGVLAYRRMGFELCGLDVSFYRGTPEDGEVGLLMSLDLDN